MEVYKESLFFITIPSYDSYQIFSGIVFTYTSQGLWKVILVCQDRSLWVLIGPLYGLADSEISWDLLGAVGSNIILQDLAKPIFIKTCMWLYSLNISLTFELSSRFASNLG